ncbi:MAG: hypothetical protein ACJ75T_02095 [Solirubrobacterales bacterium]
MSSATASATPTNIPVWKSGGAVLQYKTPSTISGQSLLGLSVKYQGFGGSTIWVSCKSLSLSNGKVENPAAGKPGTLANTTWATQGPEGAFEGCQLLQYGEKTLGKGLECTIPSKLPVETGVGTLTNLASPAGGLEFKTRIKTFEVWCPTFSAPWQFTLTGIGSEVEPENPSLEGQQYFSPKATKVEANFGGWGEASYWIALKDAKYPIKVGQLAYEESASSDRWYRGGAGRSGEGSRTLITGGVPTSLSGGSANLSLEFNNGGYQTQVVCSAGSVSGSVENPAGSGPGTASVGLSLTGCSVPKPAGSNCTLVGSTITTKTLAGKVKSGSAPSILELTPPSGEIGTFTLTGCTKPEMNHAYTISGQLFAQPQMNSGKQLGAWSIPPSLNGSVYLKVFGQKATASGEVIAEAGGEAVTMG